MIEAQDHKRISPAGKALGAQLVRLTEPAIAELAGEGEPDERCKSCAFRLGTVPNGCMQTQSDALKAVIENVPFLCHQGDKKGAICHGWFAARVQLKRAAIARGTPFNVTTCPWEFSPEDPKEDVPA